MVNIALPMGKLPGMEIDSAPSGSAHDSAQNDSARNDSERLIVLLGYGLFLIAPIGGLTALLAAIIAHMRLSHATGSWLESHYRNQLRVFWTVLIYALAMMALFTFGMGYSLTSLLWPPGWVFWRGAMVGLGWAMLLPVVGLLSLILMVWYYWRLLRGFIRALDDKPY
jgi:uncharacterized membrane protein